MNYKEISPFSNLHFGGKLNLVYIFKTYFFKTLAKTPLCIHLHLARPVISLPQVPQSRPSMFTDVADNKNFCDTEGADFPERLRQRVNLEETDFENSKSQSMQKMCQ